MTPTALVFAGRRFSITSRGVERDGKPLTRAELLLYSTDGPIWRWLREHGVRRPSPSGEGGATSRVLGGWRVAPATKAAVAARAAVAGESESAWVERALLDALRRRRPAVRAEIDPLCPTGECIDACTPEAHGG